MIQPRFHSVPSLTRPLFRVLHCVFMVAFAAIQLLAVEPGRDAHPAQTAVDAALGAMAAGDWAVVEAQARKALDGAADHPDLLAILGMALFEQSEMSAAAQQLERALQGRTRFVARSLLYHGEACLALDRLAEAQASFARLRREFPDSPEAARIPAIPLEGGNASAGPGRRRSWLNGFALVSLSYDSHPANPYDPTAVATQDRGKADWMGLGLVSLAADPETVPLRGRLTASIADYRDREDLDSFLVQAQAEAPFDLGHGAGLAPGVWLQRLWLDDAPYQDVLHLGANWSQTWADAWRSDLAPYYERRRFASSIASRDCTALGADLRAEWSPSGLAPLRRLALTCRYENAAAATDYEGWDEVGLGLAGRIALPWSGRLDLESRLRRRYGAADEPAIGKDHDETRKELGIAVSRPWFEGLLTTELSLRRVWQDGWRQYVSYHQTLVSLAVIASF